ncbi:hypothetical protein RUM44_001266 [Polyplax serrata]|uniref:Helicase ATP-binding domain-containing protein n=1 Tax=Polyplax serrata TaxID=468196 RepID=A0ABR1AL23_POLSC
MSTVHLRGYDIDFPHPVPYDIQKAYMEKVLTCLDEKCHGVLESPTGTGKTLSLFAPITAWARRKKLQAAKHIANDAGNELVSQYFEGKEHHGSWGTKCKAKVWYTARTHSQIAQTVAEVRKCNIEGLHVRVMGARDQLCINELVLEEKDSYVKTIKCKELVKAKKCKYYAKLTYEKDFKRFYQAGDVLDIEDLVSVGKSCGICPYFLAKKASESADIILLPYNYIIDRESRESNGFYLQDDVIIFDEGHNVPSTCEESYEFSFTSLDVALGIKNLQEVMLSLTKLTDDLIEDEEIDVAKHASNSMMMMEMLQKLESSLTVLKPSSELLPVSELHNFFQSAGINEAKSRELVEGISAFKSDSAKLSLNGSTLETFNLLEKMTTAVFGSAVRSFEKSVVEKSFKCSVTVDPDRNFVKKFSLFCFNPSFGIKSLMMLGSQSIIITSGTLSPLRTFISELGLPNPVTLENKHIAQKCQVPFFILGTGVNNIRMDGAFKNRKDPKYVFSLGMTLTNLVASIPDGVLLLFSSYSMMLYLKESWESDLGIWTRLNFLKRVFVEPRGKNEFINCVENYKRAIDSGNGAILMGVLRGKISEGMDFKDMYCRGVFVIGVPFPPIQDPRVIGKQKYAESLMLYNSVTKTEEKLYTQPYMSIEAMKATNQAIGRVIRHGKDYGVIVLVDYRFAWPRLFHNISSWMRGEIPVESNFQTTKKQITEFFRNLHLGKLNVNEIRCQPVDGNGNPIAGHAPYEEYDHKTQPRQAEDWIGISASDASQTSKSHSRRGPNRRDNARGHSKIEYDNDDFDPTKLLSLYRNSSWKSSQSGMSGETSGAIHNSLLSEIENSSYAATQRGFREDFKNGESESENNKRKHEEDEDSEGKNVCPKLSPSLFSPPNSQERSQPKRLTQLKVRAFFPNEKDDLNDSSNQSEIEPKKMSELTEDELRQKLIDYYKTAQRSLSVESSRTFKSTSSRYMKGEATLMEIVKLMDQLFIREGKRNLFAGFSICVKSKDRKEWKNVCRKRGVKES